MPVMDEKTLMELLADGQVDVVTHFNANHNRAGEHKANITNAYLSFEYVPVRRRYGKFPDSPKVACPRKHFFVQNYVTQNYPAEQMSYYGGAAGVTLAVWLSAKVLGLSGRGTLNSFAPMGAFLAAMVRFAEGFLAMEKVMLGVGAWMEEGIFFPVTVEFVYDESYSEFYLAVFMFEGLFSLVAMVLSLYHKNGRDFSGSHA